MLGALEAAWAHSTALGVSFADYERAGVGSLALTTCAGPTA
jgi:hypothetical protein